MRVVVAVIVLQLQLIGMYMLHHECEGEGGEDWGQGKGVKCKLPELASSMQGLMAFQLSSTTSEAGETRRAKLFVSETLLRKLILPHTNDKGGVEA